MAVIKYGSSPGAKVANCSQKPPRKAIYKNKKTRQDKASQTSPTYLRV